MVQAHILIHDERKLFDFAVECQEWWAQNCLFLEAEARKAFYDAILQAPLHADLIRNRASTEDKKSHWGDYQPRRAVCHHKKVPRYR